MILCSFLIPSLIYMPICENSLVESSMGYLSLGPFLLTKLVGVELRSKKSLLCSDLQTNLIHVRDKYLFQDADASFPRITAYSFPLFCGMF